MSSSPVQDSPAQGMFPQPAQRRAAPHGTAKASPTQTSQSRPVECQLSLTLILLLFTGATARHILKIRYNNADDGQGRKTDPIGNLHAALSSILPAISSF